MRGLLKALNAVTMSSREIAKLTGKRHDNVMQSIRTLIIDQILSPEIQEIEFMGRVLNYYSLSKRDSLVLVARLSPGFTAAMVDRWQELENKAAGVPATYVEALEVTVIQAKQLEEQAPKIEYHDRVLATGNGLTTTEIAAEFNISAFKLNQILKELKVQRWVGKRWVLTVAYLGLGLTTEITIMDDGPVTHHHMKWTEKGRSFIYGLLNSEVDTQSTSPQQSLPIH
ncbi:MAG: phage antirepressor KilAC domain-containing protein [Cycloclasticus sp.]